MLTAATVARTEAQHIRTGRDGTCSSEGRYMFLYKFLQPVSREPNTDFDRLLQNSRKAIKYELDIYATTRCEYGW